MQPRGRNELTGLHEDLHDDRSDSESVVRADSKKRGMRRRDAERLGKGKEKAGREGEVLCRRGGEQS
jgi:hypothetical protein